MNQIDIPNMIAGALGVSRGTAYDMMREALAEQPAQLATEQSSAVQPVVPDAFGTREGEHPEYIQGWNDCRAEMLKLRSKT